MPIGDVVALSDSDGDREDLIPEPPPVPKPKRRAKRPPPGASDAAGNYSDAKLRTILGSRCRCKKRDCFRLFVGDEKFQTLSAYRASFSCLHKLDQDHFVASPTSKFLVAMHKMRDLVLESKDEPNVTWKLLGHAICIRNRRFDKLFEAAQENKTSAPVDLRYLSKPRMMNQNHDIRADVVSFLANLYTSVAETLPDVRDDPLSREEELKLQKPEEEMDPYASALADVVSGKQDLPREPTKKRRHESMRSKEFSSFARPRLHVSAAVAHGWFIIFQVSPPTLPKDSNASIELLSHAVTLLKQRGLAGNKELGSEYTEHLQKYVPLLRNPVFKLDRAADWLAGWIAGSLPAYELLDVSGKPPTFCFTDVCRLKHPESRVANVRAYTKKAKVRIVHRAAACAWQQGVPWAEALGIAEKALAAADGSCRALRFTAKGKAKGKGKGKHAGKRSRP
eukprot:s3014_g4.t1